MQGAVRWLESDESESDTHSILLFVTYNGDEWIVNTKIMGEKENALSPNEATGAVGKASVN